MTINTEERPPTEERVSYLEGAYGHLATKEDVANLRADMRTAVAESETRVTRLIAELRAEIAESQTKSTRWMLAIAGFIIAAITLLDRLLG